MIKVSFNGKIVDKESAKISIFDRGFLFGDSIYEVFYYERNRPIFLEEHLKRLYKSAQRLSMNFSFDEKTLKEEINALAALYPNDQRLYVRVVITRGEGEIGLDPGLATENNRVIICKHLPDNPISWYEDGVEVIVSKVKRNSKETLDPAIKSGNYLNNVMAMTEAKEQSVFDAIMLSREGFVTELTTSNIWIVKDGVYITPPTSVGILEGITRSKLLELCLKNNFLVKEEAFKLDELLCADEVFLTSSTKKIVPIVKINDKEIGNGRPGKMTSIISNTYSKMLSE